MFYDSLSRLTNAQLNPNGDGVCPASAVAGKDKVTMTYDGTGSLTLVDGQAFTYSAYTKGQLTKISSAASTTYLTYSIQGEVKEKAVELKSILNLAANDRVYRVKNSYNHAGDLTTITYPDNNPSDGIVPEVVTIEYDSAERIKRTAGTGWSMGGDDTAYDEYGRLRSNRIDGGSLMHNFDYYSQSTGAGIGGRLSRMSVGTILNYNYTDYDVAGNLKELQDSIGGGQTNLYTYDGLGRLVAASASASVNQSVEGYSQTFTYDGQNGNLVSKLINDVLSSYTYNPDSHPQAVRAMGNDLFDYDANGNMLLRTEKGVTYTQEWTSDNKLLRVSWSNGTNNNHKVTFVYDGNGSRLLRIDQLTLPLVGGGTRAQEITTVYIDDLFEKQIVTTTQNLTAIVATIQQ